MKTMACALSLLAATPAFAYSDAEKGAFLKADANRNLKIERGEFNQLIDALAAAGFPKATRVKSWGIYGMAFSRTDANADGVITPSELEAQR